MQRKIRQSSWGSKGKYLFLFSQYAITIEIYNLLTLQVSGELQMIKTKIAKLVELMEKSPR
jgi:hypothetical protein